jgi:hypothetical protein
LRLEADELWPFIGQGSSGARLPLVFLVMPAREVLRTLARLLL